MGVVFHLSQSHFLDNFLDRHVGCEPSEPSERAEATLRSDEAIAGLLEERTPREYS